MADDDPFDPAGSSPAATDPRGASEAAAPDTDELKRDRDETYDRLLRLLNEYIDGPGLTVVIGAEHPDPNLHSFSLIASTYEDGNGTGTVGVIGPTRMRYSRAINVVDGAAQAVSRVLRDPN